MSYFVVVGLVMFVAPLASIAIDVSAGHAALTAALALRWLVFWSIGARLGMAGLRQILQPAFTARQILGIQGEDALILVRELGFANTAMGSVGLMSLWMPSWAAPMGLAGALFLGLAGLNHLLQAHRNARENFAMATDLLAALLIAACLRLAL
jgi:hypothetical protein